MSSDPFVMNVIKSLTPRSFDCMVLPAADAVRLGSDFIQRAADEIRTPILIVGAGPGHEGRCFWPAGGHEVPVTGKDTFGIRHGKTHIPQGELTYKTYDSHDEAERIAAQMRSSKVWACVEQLTQVGPADEPSNPSSGKLTPPPEVPAVDVPAGVVLAAFR